MQATAAGCALALSGTMRDLVNVAMGAVEEVWGIAESASGYIAVYSLEIILLAVTIAAAAPLIRRAAVAESGATFRGDGAAGQIESEPSPTSGRPAS